MTRLFSLFLCVILLFTFTGCSNESVEELQFDVVSENIKTDAILTAYNLNKSKVDEINIHKYFDEFLENSDNINLLGLYKELEKYVVNKEDLLDYDNLIKTLQKDNIFSYENFIFMNSDNGNIEELHYFTMEYGTYRLLTIKWTNGKIVDIVYEYVR